MRQALLPLTNEKSYKDEGESPSSRQRRLARERRRTNRLDQSDAQNETEKCNALFRMRRKRSSESVDETLARRRKDVEIHPAERRAETPEERQERLSRNAARNSVQRDSETSEERQERLSRDAMSKSLRRDSETPEERRDRLSRDAKSKSLRRDNETPEERKERLSRDAMSKSLRRDNETPEERKERLSRGVMVKSLRREKEMPEECQKRLLADTKRKSAKRREETADEKQFRNDMSAQRNRRKRQEAALSGKSGEMGIERVPFWKQWATQDEFAFAHYPRLDTFHKRMEGLTFHTCVSCEQSLPTLDIKCSTQMCKQCTNDQGNGWVGLLTSDNNMNPGRVPPPLKDLSVVEEMLIAQIAPMMHIFRLPAGRQFGYRGHVLNLPQNVHSVLTRLPRTKSNLGMVVVRQTRTFGKVNDFRVRRQRVLEALVNLKRNNKYYENIEIDSDALEALPEDGELEDLHVIRADMTMQYVLNILSTFEDDFNIFDEARHLVVEALKFGFAARGRHKRSAGIRRRRITRPRRSEKSEIENRLFHDSSTGTLRRAPRASPRGRNDAFLHRRRRG